MNSNIRVLCFLVILMVPLSLPASSNNSVSVEGYTVFFNAYNSSLLQPEVAKAYGLVRSKNRGVLSIVVRKQDGKHSQADVSASARNLSNQLRNLTIKETKDGDALYYIGDFRFTDQETLSFDVTVTPRGLGKPIEVRFKQQFFAD
jgi:hypothetical protein